MVRLLGVSDGGSVEIRKAESGFRKKTLRTRRPWPRKRGKAGEVGSAVKDGPGGAGPYRGLNARIRSGKKSQRLSGKVNSVALTGLDALPPWFQG